MGDREVKELRRIRRELTRDKKAPVGNQGNGCIKFILIIGVILIILIGIILWKIMYL